MMHEFFVLQYLRSALGPCAAIDSSGISGNDYKSLGLR